MFNQKGYEQVASSTYYFFSRIIYLYFGEQARQSSLKLKHGFIFCRSTCNKKMFNLLERGTSMKAKGIQKPGKLFLLIQCGIICSLT